MSSVSLARQIGTSTTTGEATVATSTQPGLVKDYSKQYVAGNTYNTVPLTVTSAINGWSVTRGVFVPYQTVDGAYRMRFTIAATVTQATLTGGTCTIAGVTFKSTSNYSQPITGFENSTGTNVAVSARTLTNSGNISFSHVSDTLNLYAFSGDVELDSKPTWMD